MANFGFDDMQAIQKELQEKYYDQWGGLYPEKAVRMLLWMFCEAGEAADVMKKTPTEKLLADTPERRHFIEEMCDVLLCYNITPQELEKVYREKHERNMKRW